MRHEIVRLRGRDDHDDDERRRQHDAVGQEPVLEVDRREQDQHRAEHEADERPSGRAVADEVPDDERRGRGGHDRAARSLGQELAERPARRGLRRRHGGQVRLAHVQVGVGPADQFEGLPAAVVPSGCPVQVDVPLPPVVPMVAAQAPFACANRIVDV